MAEGTIDTTPRNRHEEYKNNIQKITPYKGLANKIRRKHTLMERDTTREKLVVNKPLLGDLCWMEVSSGVMEACPLWQGAPLAAKGTAGYIRRTTPHHETNTRCVV